jgi:hypothetical protein
LAIRLITYPDPDLARKGGEKAVVAKATWADLRAWGSHWELGWLRNLEIGVNKIIWLQQLSEFQ